jgi:hypothetical protein
MRNTGETRNSCETLGPLNTVVTPPAVGALLAARRLRQGKHVVTLRARLAWVE